MNNAMCQIKNTVESINSRVSEPIERLSEYLSWNTKVFRYIRQNKQTNKQRTWKQCSESKEYHHIKQQCICVLGIPALIFGGEVDNMLTLSVFTFLCNRRSWVFYPNLGITQYLNIDISYLHSSPASLNQRHTLNFHEIIFSLDSTYEWDHVRLSVLGLLYST